MSYINYALKNMLRYKYTMKIKLSWKGTLRNRNSTYTNCV